tara:strand:+ start:83 stop:646 length:564 start_codon:yes stop_codon:yes gene_type:complete
MVNMSNFEIKVFDNVFDDKTSKKIWEYMQAPKWSYTGGSATGGRFWHMEKLDEIEFFKFDLYNKICNDFLKEKPSNFSIKRCYANGQTANQNGTAHSDDDIPNTYTFLYYPNPEWDLRWNGALFFLNHIGNGPPKNTEIIKTVSYQPNRAVFFSSNICHFAEAPSNRFAGLRVSVAWKLSKSINIKA